MNSIAQECEAPLTRGEAPRPLPRKAGGEVGAIGLLFSLPESATVSTSPPCSDGGEGGGASPPGEGGIRLLLALAFLLFASPAFASSASDTLANTESAFAEGVALKLDSAKARPVFARAAAGYDALWRDGHHTPELALNRARAHRLAGNLPKCIAALHDGLAVARFSRPLQVELEESRAAVQFPLEGDLAAQCKPPSVRGISKRMSPADAWGLAALVWLLVCGGVARFAMTRNWLWIAFAGLCVAGLITLGGFWWYDAQQREHHESLPLLVVTNDAMLRKGNADAFLPRVEPSLPKGTEVRELNRRGGWVQVQLPGGAIGWLPERSVIACGG